MMRLVFISALLTVGWASPKSLPRLDGRIVGGEDANIIDYPYQVSVLSRDEHICGGSIITVKYILTAAHCTDRSSPSILTIRAGSSIRGQGGTVVHVTKIHQHDNYDQFLKDYDISILELDKELIFGSGIDPIRLPNLNENIPIGSDAVVSGWGALSEGGSLVNQLQVVTIQMVSHSKCDDVYDGIITDRMTCAGVLDGGKDACTGDSGGPLAVNKVLVGIFSYGHGCGQRGYPGVYASVTNLRDYIKKITGE